MRCKHCRGRAAVKDLFHYNYVLQAGRWLNDRARASTPPRRAVPCGACAPARAARKRVVARVSGHVRDMRAGAWRRARAGARTRRCAHARIRPGAAHAAQPHSGAVSCRTGCRTGAAPPPHKMTFIASPSIATRCDPARAWRFHVQAKQGTSPLEGGCGTRRRRAGQACCAR